MTKSRFWFGMASDAKMEQIRFIAALLPPVEVARTIAEEACRPDREGRSAAARMVRGIDGHQRCLIALMSNSPLDEEEATRAMFGAEPTACASLDGMLARLSALPDGIEAASDIAYVGDFPEK